MQWGTESFKSKYHTLETGIGNVKEEGAYVFRFISYAEQLNHMISNTSNEIRNATRNCLEEIDEQERYVY